MEIARVLVSLCKTTVLDRVRANLAAQGTLPAPDGHKLTREQIID